MGLTSKPRGGDKRQRPGFQLERWRNWILQRCTDVRHSSRFLKEKEGFKWKWILNGGFQCDCRKELHISFITDSWDRTPHCVLAVTGLLLTFITNTASSHSRSWKLYCSFKSSFTYRDQDEEAKQCWLILWLLFGSFISKHLLSEAAQWEKMMT